MGPGGKRIFRFGVFEADASSGELRKSGMRLRLQEQPFQVLLLLLERPGEVVTREEIRQRLWSADTFVDFDHSLNTIINRIRDVLSDSASNPRFVETLAKRGYRFLAPVETPSRPQIEPKMPDAKSAPAEQAAAGRGLLTRPEDVPVISHSHFRALFLLIQIMYMIFYIIALARISAVEELLERSLADNAWAPIAIIISASVGIPLRLYLFTAVSFNIRDFGHRFSTLFPGILVLDELWSLSPFLLVQQIGPGLALAITAALAYVPFAQRTLVLMQPRDRAKG
jgi:cholera toxin transcriptional activator